MRKNSRILFIVFWMTAGASAQDALSLKQQSTLQTAIFNESLRIVDALFSEAESKRCSLPSPADYASVRRLYQSFLRSRVGFANVFDASEYPDLLKAPQIFGKSGSWSSVCDFVLKAKGKTPVKEGAWVLLVLETDGDCPGKDPSNPASSKKARVFPFTPRPINTGISDPEIDFSFMTECYLFASDSLRGRCTSLAQWIANYRKTGGCEPKDPPPEPNAGTSHPHPVHIAE